ncbi:PREDICTED: E3 ubiquitin-protein ligase HERC2-like [Ipomoea nil]|uniref:E3 ubiquitin-protein ligase HERC2-like n=1 Tax=Ipomoea nil TaxID=35883 RepID=UPI000900FF34|nr:PREDICTED: E3 ubiquitin-protein ligase HERC2-like [Ipomoea nil]
MADPVSYGSNDQGLLALKKGTQLVKYSRKGKPKLCPFRLSPDEKTLIWYSRGSERNLNLTSVSKIIPGQRTPVFKRFLRPEKDYLSFSLIYKNGERSLDLICKDNEEADVWIAGLTALIPNHQARNRRTHSDISDFQDGGRPFGGTLEFTSRDWVSVDGSRETFPNFPSSDVGSAMQVRGDGFRVSVSSTPSCSSGGSGVDDIESLGDVYLWGQVWSDGTSKDASGNPIPIKQDVFTPKPLESNVVLDVHQIACGVRHIALVTRQGEVFTWGEESGGRLGHGVEKDFSRPRLVEFLAVTSVDFVASGEHHTCAVSQSGDLYTWGNGAHNAGILGRENDVSHWIPKRLSGALEGLQVLSVACGTWHSALSTISGKVFSFGDGTFGVLGHGNRQTVPFPREIQSLNGFKTVKVACGVWHTAAIVEVGSQSGSNVSSRKLFTWGDGDKNRLGHGNKDTFLLPTVVSALIDYNIHQIACGHNITVALTTSGHVFTMGSNTYGQLGNPKADGKLPCLVQDQLVGEFAEDIASGDFHVAVLTSRSEVFTWGRGANGRLGHGDAEDRKIPTFVEGLKDRHVKNIACGSNYTASICIHKWVSGADQSICTGCRQAFGFTRKRHNCYNCGLVHCHACSSKKALRAALAPTPGKPHRVCDSCYLKLKHKAAEGQSSHYTKTATPSKQLDGCRSDRPEVRSSRRILLPPKMEPVKYLEVRSTKPGTKIAGYNIVRASQVPSRLQLKDVSFPSSFSALQNALKPVGTTTPSNSRPASPFSSRRPTPPRLPPPPVFSRGIVDSLKKTNEVLNQEVNKLQFQVKNKKQKSDIQDTEILKLKRKAQEAASLATERLTKCSSVIETVKSIGAQLKEVTEKLPFDIAETVSISSIQDQVESFLNTVEAQAASEEKTVSTSESAVGFSETSNSVYGTPQENNQSSNQETRGANQSSVESPNVKSVGGRQKEVTEQFEPGVYVTLLQLTNGTKIFKRVRFGKRRFVEQQAEEWWKENKDRVLKRYLPSRTNNASTESSSSTPQPSEESKETT